MKSRLTLSVFVASIVAILGTNLLQYDQSIALFAHISNSNMLLYAAFVLIYLFIFSLTFKLIVNIRDNSKMEYVFGWGILVCGLFILLYCYIKELEVAFSEAGSFFWHSLPMWIVILGCISTTFVYITVVNSIDSYRYKGVIWGLYAVIVMYSGYVCSYLNYMNSDPYHGTAIYTSVYNVLNGAPYGDEFNSVYGNYALILLLPMKLLGGEYFDFSRLMAVLMMLSTALCIFVIHNLVRKADARILCVVCLGLPLSLRTSNYWQAWPLRILFPMILIAWLTFCDKCAHKHTRLFKFRIVIEYVIISLAIIWNKESGIVCLVGWGAAYLYRFLAERNVTIVKVIKKILVCLVMATSLVSAYCTVGIYNMSVSGQWISWKTFLFPLLSKEYIVDDLEIKLSVGIWPWMFVVLLFCVILSIGVSKIWNKSNCEVEKWDVFIAAAVIGLGMMTYFMNRAADFNIDIVYYEAVICLGLLACSREKDSLRNMSYALSVRYVSMVTLIALTMGVVLRSGYALQMHQNSEITERNSILDFKDIIAEEIPQDTYAFGLAIPELYSVLGWENRCYIIDSSDYSLLYDTVNRKILYDLENEETILTAKDIISDPYYDVVYGYIIENYVLLKEYEYNSRITYCLWQHK